jgi:uncharacterized protein with PhoU and TrkA domain
VLELDILGTFVLEGREIFTARLTVEPGSSLVDRSIDQLTADFKIMVLSHKAAEKAARYSPPGSDLLRSGDVLVVHGELPDLRRLGKQLKGRRRDLLAGASV